MIKRIASTEFIGQFAHFAEQLNTRNESLKLKHSHCNNQDVALLLFFLITFYGKQQCNKSDIALWF